MSDYYGCEDNCIEWITGKDTVSVSLSQKRFKTKVKKLAEKFPEEVKIISENADGSLFVHVPLSYIRICKPREISEEHREQLAKRMRDMSVTSDTQDKNDLDFDEVEVEP